MAGVAKTMTMQTKFERHLREGRFFTRHDVVIIAVSTGVDSMVLLDLIRHLPAQQRPQLLVAHVNHELRKQSKIEERFIRDYCDRHHLELAVAHWPQREHPRHGVEEAGRQFRYAFFAQLMKKYGARVTLTAHHADDLAETIMMKLTRGGQLNQLIGISDRRSFATGWLVRPLLPFTKQELYAYAHRHQLKWFEDYTNRELTVSRNRYRHQIIPSLRAENPHFIAHLLEYRDQLQTLLLWRDHQVKAQLSQLISGPRLRVKGLLALPAAQQAIILQAWLEQAGIRNLKARLLDQLLTALANPYHPQRRLTLPGEWVLVKDYGWCWLENSKKITTRRQKATVRVVKLGQRYPIDDQTALVVTAAPLSGTQQQEMWLAPQQLPLRLRRWQPGDRLLLKGGGHQEVHRVLINQKVPTTVRQQQLVLVDAQGTVVWLVGRKWSWFARPAGYRQNWRRLLIGTRKQRGEKHG